MFALVLLLATRTTPAGAQSGPGSAQGDSRELVAEIQVRGNVATSDDEMRRLAGIGIGDAVSPGTIDEITARLRATNRFTRVEVLKRFASISDPTQIVIVIVVDEGPVAIERTGNRDAPTRVVRTRGAPMFLPVLRYDDGYGFTYGAKVALPDVAGSGIRVTFPLTWGGEKQAAVELDRDFDGRRTTISGGGSLDRRTHPYFDQDEDRGRLWARVQREIAPAFHAGTTGGWQHVSFLGGADSFTHAGADATFDNRLDPLTARNAVYGRVSWEHDRFAHGGVSRWELDGRAYVGLFAQTVLVVRAVRDDASGPLPPYLQPILGGVPTLRGFRLGTAIGDRLVAGSIEVRQPLNSPLQFARIGVNAFIDAGTAYPYGESAGDQHWDTGIGGGVWAAITIVRFSVAVAHGVGATTRVHFEAAVTF